MTGRSTTADVCLLLEGSYPYVAGGVSTWVHDLLRAQSDLTFHLIALVADRTERPLCYEIPRNVVGLTPVFLQNPVLGERSFLDIAELFETIEPALIRIQQGGTLSDVSLVLNRIGPYRDRLGRAVLLDSPIAWRTLCRMYEATVPNCSFLDYFWTWRSQLGGMFATLLSELPPARVYHTVSTGYAGLMAARASLETGRPAIVTEHGIYTNERRVEISMADWLSDHEVAGLGIDKSTRNLRDLWIDTFVTYSRACYAACDKIITLYSGNQAMQRRDGAAPERLAIIPNGVDYDSLSRIARDPAPRPPTIALIGRVVPIKDVKTFIRTVAILKTLVPDVVALVMGPTEEDPDYFAECRDMVAQMSLGETLKFTGRVNLRDHLGSLDAIALTSVSEAQPLVILEAGSVGVPTVATDVGACREMVLGGPDEAPPLGAGGTITPLSNPAATAQALAEFLLRPEWRKQCSEAIRQRVARYYNKQEIDQIYRNLYETYRAMPSREAPQLEVA
ncbi:MAG: GT4 family glycosyltransferase PelF [Gemmatimonadales bacterium]